MCNFRACSTLRSWLLTNGPTPICRSKLFSCRACLGIIFETCRVQNPNLPSRRHQTCHFRKRATSAPAEGPSYGLDFARHCEFPLRALSTETSGILSRRKAVRSVLITSIRNKLKSRVSDLISEYVELCAIKSSGSKSNSSLRNMLQVLLPRKCAPV